MSRLEGSVREEDEMAQRSTSSEPRLCGAKEDKADANGESKQNQELDGEKGRADVAREVSPLPATDAEGSEGSEGAARRKGDEISPTEEEEKRSGQQKSILGRFRSYPNRSPRGRDQGSVASRAFAPPKRTGNECETLRIG